MEHYLKGRDELRSEMSPGQNEDTKPLCGGDNVKKWKILSIVFIVLFVLVSLYGVLATVTILDIRDDPTLYETAIQPRYVAGTGQLANIMRNELGINKWQSARVKHNGHSVIIEVTTEAGEILIAYGAVSAYEEWDISRIDTETGGTIWSKD